MRRVALSFAAAGALSTLPRRDPPRSQPRQPPAFCQESKETVDGQVVSSDPAYISGIKVYDIGIKEDPVPGMKRGKGSQALISPVWLSRLSELIAVEYPLLCRIVERAREQGPGADTVFLVNLANAFFLRSLEEGLHTANSRRLMLLTSWCLMAVAEVDDVHYAKYSPAEREALRARFYANYAPGGAVVPGSATVAGWPTEAELGADAYVPPCRMDLVPACGLERLAIHNELCVIKYGADADLWLREGFMLSRRISSLKRHFDGVLTGDRSEDHVSHAIWNAMALTHVVALWPQKNDLPDFVALSKEDRPGEGS